MNRDHSRSTFLTTARRAAAGGAALALLLCGGAGAAHAGDWSWSLTPYAWLTDVGVNVTLDGRDVVDEQIPVGDLIEDLETIFQLRFEVQNGAWGVMGDLFDVTMADGAEGVALPNGAGEADVDGDVGMTIFDLAAFHDAGGDHQGLAYFGGVRILNERASADATFRPAGGAPVARQYETGDTMVDALVGVRLSRRFARQWGWQMQADVSAGGTDYTWSIGPTLSYAFGKLGRYGIQAGYRRLTVDFQDEDGIDTRMTLSGFLLGVRTSF